MSVTIPSFSVQSSSWICVPESTEMIPELSLTSGCPTSEERKSGRVAGERESWRGGRETAFWAMSQAVRRASASVGSRSEDEAEAESLRPFSFDGGEHDSEPRG